MLGLITINLKAIMTDKLLLIAFILLFLSQSVSFGADTRRKMIENTIRFALFERELKKLKGWQLGNEAFKPSKFRNVEIKYQELDSLCDWLFVEVDIERDFNKEGDRFTLAIKAVHEDSIVLSMTPGLMYEYEVFRSDDSFINIIKNLKKYSGLYSACKLTIDDVVNCFLNIVRSPPERQKRLEIEEEYIVHKSKELVKHWDGPDPIYYNMIMIEEIARSRQKIVLSTQYYMFFKGEELTDILLFYEWTKQ